MRDVVSRQELELILCEIPEHAGEALTNKWKFIRYRSNEFIGSTGQAVDIFYFLLADHKKNAGTKTILAEVGVLK